MNRRDLFQPQEVASATGSYWVAVHGESGIVSCGQATRELAEEEARALNAAYELGRRCGESQAEAEAAGTRPKSAFATALRAVIDQKRPHLLEFVGRHPVEQLGKVLTRYGHGSTSDDAIVVLDSVLAAYGLMTAILAHEELRHGG